MIGVIYQKLINETENLSTTDNKQLKLCKLKFQNCYHLNGNVPNIAVFVDKFISRLKFVHVSLSGLKLISLQLVMLSVFMSGVGVCIGIINGDVLFRILPFYLMALIGLYFYFSIATVVDIQGRKENLKIHLIDYLENHMLNRLKNNLEISQENEKSVSVNKIINKRHKPDHKLAEALNEADRKNLKEAEKELREANPEEANQEETDIEEASQGKANQEEANQEANPGAHRDVFNKNYFSSARYSREKELKATTATFSEDEIEELLRELII